MAAEVLAGEGFGDFRTLGLSKKLGTRGGDRAGRFRAAASAPVPTRVVEREHGGSLQPSGGLGLLLCS